MRGRQGLIVIKSIEAPLIGKIEGLRGRAAVEAVIDILTGRK